MEKLNLLTQIEEVGGELGEPDCKLTEPFVVHEDGTLSLLNGETVVLRHEHLLLISNKGSIRGRMFVTDYQVVFRAYGSSVPAIFIPVKSIASLSIVGKQ